MHTMNTLISLEASSLSSSESKYYNMKQFINAVQDYMNNRAEDTANLINRHLQLISVTIDLSVFDPHTSVVSEFFVSLHELLSALEPSSSLAWCCVNVLSISCRNSAARNSLIHTYQFLPQLSRLLGDHLSMEKKIRLLLLMQELTCGIKISWQIPHLQHLMLILTRWVSSEQEEIVTLSLGVLVNLCYKNLPAIYTLSRCVDIKRFIRTTIMLKGVKIEVHVCKLIIILDHMNGKVPESSLIKLIEVTFKSTIEAFKAKDSILLRHIVEFFLDIKLHNGQENVLLNFNRYDVEFDKLLKEIENNMMSSGDASDQDPECMSLVLEFLHSLIELKLPKLVPFYQRLISISLKWIQTDVVCSQALTMLCTIAVNVSNEDSYILEPLLKGLPFFLFELEHKNEEIPTYMEYNKRMSALMQLIRALVQAEPLRGKVLSVVKEEHLSKIFVPLIGNNSPRTRASDADTFTTEATCLYVNALAVVHEIAKYDTQWNNIHDNLLQQKQMHMIIAQAFFSGSKGTKSLIFSMASSHHFPRDDISAAMSELQPLVQLGAKSDSNSQEMTDNVCFANMTVAQTESLNEIMAKIKEAVSQNNLFNISTSDVMELYEYKLASMGHAERAAMASMEAASRRCTHLQHRTAQLTAELSRLHQLLFHTQQCHEEAIKDIDVLTERTKELSNKLDAEKGRNKVTGSQLSLKEKMLQEKEYMLDEMTRRLKETMAAKTLLEEQYNDLKGALAKLEENLIKKEKAYERKEDLLNRANGTIEHLKTKVADVEKLLLQKETELSSRIKELADVSKDLMNKKQLIDTITKLANSQAHFNH